MNPHNTYLRLRNKLSGYVGLYSVSFLLIYGNTDPNENGKLELVDDCFYRYDDNLCTYVKI